MKRNWIEIMEAAYALDGDEEQWLQGIADLVRPTLDRGKGIVGYFFDASAEVLKISSYVDDGLAHVKIVSPAIGVDGLIHIQAGKPTTLTAASVRVPAGPTFTWTTQIGTQDIAIVGGPTATTTATFSLGNAHCITTGTLNVTTADASGGPVRDSVPFELDGDCQPH